MRSGESAKVLEWSAVVESGGEVTSQLAREALVG